MRCIAVDAECENLIFVDFYWIFGDFLYMFFACRILTKMVTYVHIPQNLRIRSEGTERHSALN